MNWNQMDYFQRVYREKSFVAAARKVPMSSQGLAKAIRALEAEIGVPLFEATKGEGLTPTPYAEVFLEFCGECQDSLDRLRRSLDEVTGTSREVINLAAAIGAFGLLGMEFVSDFCRANAGTDITVDDLPDLKVEQALREGSDILGLTVQPVPDEFETIELCSCERYVWMRADDELAGRKSVAARDLEGRTIALVGPFFKNYGLLTELLARENVHPAKLVTSSEMMWLHQFVHDGHGVAFTAQSVISLYKDDASVVALPMPGMSYTIGISWLRGHELTPAEQSFVEACVAKVRPSWSKRLRRLFG